MPSYLTQFMACLIIASAAAGCATGEVKTSELRDNCDDSQPVPAVTGETLTLLTLNASHARKTAWNQMLVSTERTYANLNDIAALLDEAGADVVALQEADAPSRWSGKFDHVAYLRDNSSYACSLLGEHADTWLYSFGTALLSRVRLRNSRSVTFPSTPPTTTKGFVATTVEWNPGNDFAAVTLVSVHLDFSRKSVRDSQVSILVEALQDVPSPLIVMGDLNSYWEQKQSHVQQLADALELVAYAPDSEALGTYKAEDGKRLDWILASADLEFVDYRVLPQKVSDHLAVYAEISPAGSKP